MLSGRIVSNSAMKWPMVCPTGPTGRNWTKQSHFIIGDSSSYVSLPTYIHNTERPVLGQSSRHMAPDQRDRRIADDTHWTMISHKCVSVEVLQQAVVRYEAGPDCVVTHGVLSREQRARLVRESEATITSRPPPIS